MDAAEALHPFLTTRWESLVLLNYRCPRELLEPLVPVGTELDDWRGESLVSLVGLMFRRTRVMGVPVPGHRTFEEVNLRFYVRRIVAGEVRKAVVFIRELVPRRAIALVARLGYNEPYRSVRMSHTVRLDPRSGGRVEYGWRLGDDHYRMAAAVSGPARPIEAGGKAEFITEHYWGYTRQRDGSTLEYRVEHSRWPVWEPEETRFEGDAERLYGTALGDVLSSPPESAYVAVGSEVTVYRGVRI